MAILHTEKGHHIKPRTRAQENLAQSVENNTIVFATGPAGTGKTFMALALAMSALKNDDTNQLLLTRPAVQAEDLGFLPGDLNEKMEPYMLPFRKILKEFMSVTKAHNLEENNCLRYEALGFLRGHTIGDSWAILDEAQNATRDQLRMFLTRLGSNSKAIITGDPEQTDLENPRASALSDAEFLLSSINDVKFVEFSEDDIVRHKVVGEVIKAYRNDKKRKTQKRNQPDRASDLGDIAEEYEKHEPTE